jgi:hypothetical protein
MAYAALHHPAILVLNYLILNNYFASSLAMTCFAVRGTSRVSSRRLSHPPQVRGNKSK